MVSVAERFWAKVDQRSLDECWPWQGAHTTRGYGHFRLSRQRAVQAHRLAYEMTIGPIPDGAELDHLCRKRDCVNPAHLDAVSHRENLLRGQGWAGINARKTHCIRGHPLNDARVYRGMRICRACKALRRQHG